MDGIKELLAQIKLFARFDVAVADKLEELENRIYACEKNTERMTVACRSLEKRYSEMLMVLKDIKPENRQNG